MNKKGFMLKLARLVMKFAAIETDKGELIYEGELVDGVEVFIEIEGELTPAPNGDYRTEDRVITVEDGKVVKIEEIVVEDPKEEPTEDPAPVEMDEKDDRIAELEARITEMEAVIAEKDARIAELEAELASTNEKLEMSIAKPAHIEVKDSTVKNKENKALKYFK